MESGGDYGVKLEPHNLRDLLRIKEDDHRNNFRQISSSNGGGSCGSSSGLTLLALLNDKVAGPPSPADEPLRNVQSSRTLYDIIREERLLGYGGGRSDSGRSWRLLRDKIRRRQGATASWSNPETTDVPLNNPHHRNRTRRHSDRFDSLATTSVESTTQPSTVSSPAPAPESDITDPISVQYRSPILETEWTTGRFRQTMAPPPTNSRSVVGEELAAEHNAGEGTDQSGAGEQPARTSLMTLLAENDRQMGLKRSAYVMCEELKAAAAAAEGEGEVEAGEEAAEYNNCCVCLVRHKGAAFIPCGHTFCRLCSRELWVQRGTCPICNSQILEILDIF
ncbi:uncharacterized protein LOC127253863 [Andrographis paniculata]|uniref:uncharacterized protein LOC127253863 n=1 Tax=Andrographis paniculata TaxID=175694 RepID=UPI0021E98AA9|nr:uncharacterized protein LOC127253863 [Andrographis paniculata]